MAIASASMYGFRVARVVNSIVIRRPIEDVFQALTDVEKTSIWFPADVQERWTSPPPHGVGSTRHAVVSVFGRQVENDAVATEYEPPNRAVMQGTSPNAPFITALTFRREDGGTRVRVDTTLMLRGAQRIVGPPMAWWYRRAWSRGLERLKQLMELGEL